MKFVGYLGDNDVFLFVDICEFRRFSGIWEFGNLRGFGDVFFIKVKFYFRGCKCSCLYKLEGRVECKIIWSNGDLKEKIYYDLKEVVFI